MRARLIIFVLHFSTLIHFTQEEEERLFQVLLKARESREWGAYKALTPTEKYCIWLQSLRGVWVSTVHLVWSVLTLVLVVVACSTVVLVFRPDSVFVPAIGPHPRVAKPSS